eukprot:SAG31_NODE_29035_length_401_cov_14.523179_1_plen_25_part_10
MTMHRPTVAHRTAAALLHRRAAANV